MDREGALFALYRVRPDLWAVTRLLEHCKRSPYHDLVKATWEKLSEGDQQIITDVAAGKIPVSK